MYHFGTSLSSMIYKIISGGQTGADQGGLQAAKRLGLETGGWTPRGWRTEAGPMPSLADYGLREFPAWSYPPRTKANVRDSDGTIVFGRCWEPGSALTIKLCRELSKPCLYFDRHEFAKLLPAFQKWLQNEKIEVLNVAGNRESKNKGIQQQVEDFLVRALSR